MTGAALPLLRRTGVWLLLLAAQALADRAAAETRLVEGHSLSMVSTLSETVSITVDPTLRGTVRLTMDHGLDCVTTTGGGEVAITTARCDADTSGLDVAIPADMPVTLEVAGTGEMRVGDMRSAPLAVTVTASGDLKGGAVTALTLSLRGSGDATFTEADGPITVTSQASGDLRIGRLSGTLALKQSGSGDVAIGTIQAGSVDAQGSSSGDLLIGGGSIASLHARRAGSGDMVVAANVVDADLAASGGGDMKLGQVSGAVRRDASGGSDIVVGGGALANQIAGRVAQAISAADDTNVRIRAGGAFSMIKHFVTIGVVVAVLVMVWRAISRAGGFAGIRTRVAGAAPQGSPSHPGVLSLAETMQRLDQRLGRVEGYVTSREFDLQRKFRDLK